LRFSPIPSRVIHAGAPLRSHTARVYLGKSTLFYPTPQLLKDLSRCAATLDPGGEVNWKESGYWRCRPIWLKIVKDHFS